MLKNKAFFKYSMFTWLSIIWLVSSIPGKSLPHIDALNLDKLAHTLVYLILSMLVFINYNNGLFKNLSRQYILLIAIILAGLDEAHQVFIPNRYVSLYDMAANLLGLTAGYLLIRPTKDTHD